MQYTLRDQLNKNITPSLFSTQEEYTQFRQLLTCDEIVKASNPTHHCGVMFIPYNTASGEIFIVHHKKANQWLVPGGHIEKNELLEDALKREGQEEIGINLSKRYKPFMHSVMPVYNKKYSCRLHYDTWFLLNVNEVFPDPTEFNETKWVAITDAQKFITHPTYLEAINKIYVI